MRSVSAQVLTLSFAAYCHTAAYSHTDKDMWARLADEKKLSPVFCEALYFVNHILKRVMNVMRFPYF